MALGTQDKVRLGLRTSAPGASSMHPTCGRKDGEVGGSCLALMPRPLCRDLSEPPLFPDKRVSPCFPSACLYILSGSYRKEGNWRNNLAALPASSSASCFSVSS